jgi:hypothetical protein
VPGVATLEALAAAVRRFDVGPLGLRVDPEGDRAVRESLRRTGLVRLGERHGVEQTPVLVEELVGWFRVGGIALEWSEVLRPWLDRWLADGIVADPAEDDAGSDVWGGDGRLSAGQMAVVRRLAAAGLGITLIDGATVPGPPRPAEPAEAMERRWWSDRDAAMADRVLAAPAVPGGRLVVAGSLHTRLEPLPVDDPRAAHIGVPMGVELARRRPGLCSIECVYGPGHFYNLGLRRSVEDVRVPHLGGPPRLIMHAADQAPGELLLLVPSPRAATVPHRQLE